MYFVCHIINGAGFWFPSDSVSVHPAIHPLNHLSSDDFSMSDFWCKKWLEGRTDGRTNIQLCCDMKIEFFFIEIISFSHLFVGELRLWFVWAFLLRQKRNVYCCFYDLLIVFFLHKTAKSVLIYFFLFGLFILINIESGIFLKFEFFLSICLTFLYDFRVCDSYALNGFLDLRFIMWFF